VATDPAPSTERLAAAHSFQGPGQVSQGCAGPPPGTMPSSTAALWRWMAIFRGARLFHFISVSVAAPTFTTATTPESLPGFLELLFCSVGGSRFRRSACGSARPGAVTCHLRCHRPPCGLVSLLMVIAGGQCRASPAWCLPAETRVSGDQLDHWVETVDVFEPWPCGGHRSGGLDGSHLSTTRRRFTTGVGKASFSNVSA